MKCYSSIHKQTSCFYPFKLNRSEFQHWWSTLELAFKIITFRFLSTSTGSTWYPMHARHSFTQVNWACCILFCKVCLGFFILFLMFVLSATCSTSSILFALNTHTIFIFNLLIVNMICRKISAKRNIFCSYLF